MNNYRELEFLAGITVAIHQHSDNYNNSNCSRTLHLSCDWPHPLQGEQRHQNEIATEWSIKALDCPSILLEHVTVTTDQVIGTN